MRPPRSLFGELFFEFSLSPFSTPTRVSDSTKKGERNNEGHDETEGWTIPMELLIQRQSPDSLLEAILRARRSDA